MYTHVKSKPFFLNNSQQYRSHTSEGECVFSRAVCVSLLLHKILFTKTLNKFSIDKGRLAVLSGPNPNGIGGQGWGGDGSITKIAIAGKC